MTNLLIRDPMMWSRLELYAGDEEVKPDHPDDPPEIKRAIVQVAVRSDPANFRQVQVLGQEPQTKGTEYSYGQVIHPTRSEFLLGQVHGHLLGHGDPTDYPRFSTRLTEFIIGECCPFEIKAMWRREVFWWRTNDAVDLEGKPRPGTTVQVEVVIRWSAATGNVELVTDEGAGTFVMWERLINRELTDEFRAGLFSAIGSTGGWSQISRAVALTVRQFRESTQSGTLDVRQQAFGPLAWGQLGGTPDV